MRFVSFYDAQARIVPGLLLGEPDDARARVLDGSHPHCLARLGQLAPAMLHWIEQGLQDVGQRLLAGGPPADALRPLAGLRLAAPLPRPGKVVGAAFNYVDALAERNMPHPAEPVVFVKSGRTVIGPGEPIVLGPALEHVTYEAELAAVIGTPALRVSRQAALSHVCAYTIFNDVSVTAMVKADGGFVRGKNQPTSGPLGPWLATPEEIGDPMALDIGLEVDGQVLQQSSTARMLFDIATLIEYVSARMPLDPGDVIATGTPAGVAGAHTPPRWLAAGSTVTLAVQGLGRLSNPVVAGGAAQDTQ
ncbi:fumarylacetoacetate hydrolase family protein [Orrella sp. JC864]|uniref:fumarylacetoacetate hydrolase family protein n=1 Tax=Orrella sp. JC864 TaxID=3120298 RepID=UPI00300AA365